MDLKAELLALRRHLHELASEPDDGLVERYALKRPPLPPGLYWRLRRLAGSLYRRLQAVGVIPSYPWPAALKHAPGSSRSKPFLIWAVGTDRETLREACSGFRTLQQSLEGFAPVLVTDVADFAFYSRLGWLVEYLPELPGDGEAYEARKARFLARLYRGAPALTVAAGLAMDSKAEEIRRWVTSGRWP